MPCRSSATQGDLALAVREHTKGRGADRVIELTGAYPALHQAIRVAGAGGTVIAAGFYQGPATALALGEEFHHNQVTLVSSQIGSLPRCASEPLDTAAAPRHRDPALRRRSTRSHAIGQPRDSGAVGG